MNHFLIVPKLSGSCFPNFLRGNLLENNFWRRRAIESLVNKLKSHLTISWNFLSDIIIRPLSVYCTVRVLQHVEIVSDRKIKHPFSFYLNCFLHGNVWNLLSFSIRESTSPFTCSLQHFPFHRCHADYCRFQREINCLFELFSPFEIYCLNCSIRESTSPFSLQHVMQITGNPDSGFPAWN